MKDLPPFLITMFIKIVKQLCPQNKSKVGHPIKYETEVYLRGSGIIILPVQQNKYNNYYHKHT